MEKLFSAPVVVAFWGLLNVVALVVLAGFLGGHFGGHLIELYIYIGSALLVFLLAGLAWRARRRRPSGLSRGLVVPRRPASALLLALAFMLLWLGLAFGLWLPVLAVVPLLAAGLMEWFALRGARKLPAHVTGRSPQASPSSSFSPSWPWPSWPWPSWPWPSSSSSDFGLSTSVRT